MKTVILSKSCSRCGGSTIFKGQSFQKSVRRATPNGIGKKKRQTSLQAPSPDALFRSRTRFWSIFGSILESRPDPKMAKKLPQGNTTPIFWQHFFDFLAFCSLGRVPEGSRSASGGSEDPPGPDFARILQYFFAGSIRILSDLLEFRRDVAGIRTQPQ